MTSAVLEKLEELFAGVVVAGLNGKLLAQDRLGLRGVAYLLSPRKMQLRELAQDPDALLGVRSRL